MPSSAYIVPDGIWRSAKLFNLARAALALLLGAVAWLWGERFGPSAEQILLWIAGVYLSLTILAGLALIRKTLALRHLLNAIVSADILFIVLTMHFTGGLRTGVGLLLLPFLAAAGLISRGRISLFYASLATITLLSQQFYGHWMGTGDKADWLQAALLSVGCFATAALAHRLSAYASQSEQRGVDLANMAQINRLVIQHVSDGVLVLDKAGRIRQFNQRAEGMLGRGMQAGRTELVQFCPSLSHALNNWRAGHSQAMFDLILTRQTVRPRFMPVKVGDSEGGVLVFLEDIQRLQYEAQQLKLAALGRLTANIAHEIRNPLSAISHAAQLLAEDAHDAASQRLTRIMLDHVRRLDGIVRAVLDLNRRDQARRVEIHLKEWLSAFINEFVELEKISVQIGLDCPSGAVVRFDEGQLHQVLWNLCRNGWRYGNKSSASLHLRVSQSNELWVLDVRDDGPGVAASVEAQLFEPFFTTDAKGTGLGLYIAREICAGNDSMLEYQAQEPGLSLRGACFRLSFAALAVQHETHSDR